MDFNETWHSDVRFWKRFTFLSRPTPGKSFQSPNKFLKIWIENLTGLMLQHKIQQSNTSGTQLLMIELSKIQSSIISSIYKKTVYYPSLLQCAANAAEPFRIGSKWRCYGQGCDLQGIDVMSGHSTDRGNSPTSPPFRHEYRLSKFP